MDQIYSDIDRNVLAQDFLDHIVPDRASYSRHNNSRNDYNQFSWRIDLLFRKNLLYISDGPTGSQVLQQCHDTPMASHFGDQKTLELVT